MLSVSFLYGVGVGVYQWPPFSLLENAKQVIDRAYSVTKSVSPATHGVTYQVTTYRQSYFYLNSSGQLEEKNGLPFRLEGTYSFERRLDPRTTAIIVMDPWIDMASIHLNEFYGRITKSRIVPLLIRALDRGHPIIVLTNDPDDFHYNTKVHPGIAELASKGQIEIIYHQNFDDKKFAVYLRTRGINTLIYIGFASNICVVGRQMGMISMMHQGFKLFFVPEASAAVEYPDSWDDQSIHSATTKIISQWIAEIIPYDEFMGADAIN